MKKKSLVGWTSTKSWKEGLEHQRLGSSVDMVRVPILFSKKSIGLRKVRITIEEI